MSYNYEKLTPFKKYIIQNFPYIDADFDALTNYELYAKVVEYLNKVIEQMNLANETVAEYTDFVTNYFENLDVQEEINQKLDEMATTGELQELLSGQYEELKTEVNNEISMIRSNVNYMMTVPPEIVTSTSSMTNHDKIYILSSNMHIYYWNNSWVDSGIVYGSNTNAVIGFGSTLNTDSQWAAFNYNFDNLTPNRIYVINPQGSIVRNILNAPSEIAGDVSKMNGCLITQCYDSRTLSACCQIYYTRLGKVFWRIAWGGTPVYGEWFSIDKSITDMLDLKNVVMGTGATLYSDAEWSAVDYNFDNLPLDRIFVINPQGTIVGNIINAPTEIAGDSSKMNGCLFTMSYSNRTKSGACQLYFTRLGKVFWRIAWGATPVYGEWYSLNDTIKKEFANIDKSRILSAFKCYGIVGDSLASGECAYGSDNDVHYVDLYDISWGQALARINNNKAINFSKGGLTTRTFFTVPEGYQKMINPDNKCDCYFIGLGINDINLGSNYIGSSSDINLNDSSLNADTFYGNYGKIIQSIKTLQPKAKIFCFTIPTGTSGIALSINNAIRNMENIFTENTYIIDLVDHKDYYTSNYITSNKRSGHYNAVAYSDMAYKINEWVSEYMKENYSEFRQIEFIGTNYEWDFE